MKIDRVTATIKYSQDTGKGAWKAVEVGAEAAVDARETWQTAQARLYAELGQQLKVLWANGNGGKAQDGSEKPVAPAPAPEPTEPPTPLLPGTPNGLQAAQPWRGRLAEPQHRRWEMV